MTPPEAIYIAEHGRVLWSCPYIGPHWRCGRCMRGRFRGTLGNPGTCRVCGAEHWIGYVRLMRTERPVDA